MTSLEILIQWKQSYGLILLEPSMQARGCLLYSPPTTSSISYAFRPEEIRLLILANLIRTGSAGLKIW